MQLKNSTFFLLIYIILILQNPDRQLSKMGLYMLINSFACIYPKCWSAFSSFKPKCYLSLLFLYLSCILRNQIASNSVGKDSSVTPFAFCMCWVSFVNCLLKAKYWRNVFYNSHLSEMNTNASVACGVLMALRVLRHLACPLKTTDRFKGEKA